MFETNIFSLLSVQITGRWMSVDVAAGIPVPRREDKETVTCVAFYNTAVSNVVINIHPRI